MARKGKNKPRSNTNNSGNDDEQQNGSRFVATDLLMPFLIFALVILFFLPAVTGGKVFFTGDVMNVYNPYQAINAEQLAAGKMPLWTDRFFCGFPLFAESQGAVFYPPTRLAYYLLPASHAFTLDALFHFFLAGLFMYICARYLGQKPLAALVAATAFAFSGLFCTLIMNFTIFRSATWIPIIFYLNRRSLNEPGLKWTFLLALSFVFQMMGGSLQVTAITCLLLGIDTIYVVFASLFQGKFTATFLRILKLALALTLAVGLYAFQLWPTFELTNLAHRGVEKSYETAASYSFPPEHLVDIVMPTYYGDAGKSTELPGVTPAPNFFGYIGIIGLALALYGLGSKRSGILWPVAIIFVILSLGPAGGLFDIVYRTIPFFDRFRGPDRFLMVFIFCAALLAGFGANKIASTEEQEEEEHEKGRRRKKEKEEEDEDEEEAPRSKGIYILAFFIIVILAILGALPLMGAIGNRPFDIITAATVGNLFGITINPEDSAQYEIWRSHVPWAILYFCAFAAAIPLVNILFGRTAGGRGLVFLFLIFNCLDLVLIATQNYNCRLIDGRFFGEDPKSVAFVKKENPNARVYSFGRVDYAESLFGDIPVTAWYQGDGGSDDDYFKFREIVAPNLSAYFGLYDAGGFASLFTEDFYLFEGPVINQLSYIASGNNIPSNLPNGRPRHMLLDTMAAEYIITPYQLPEGERFKKVYDGDVDIYRNRMALPRAYVVHPANVYDIDYSKPEELVSLVDAIGNFDFEGSVIVPAGSIVPTSPDNPGISFNIMPSVVEPDKIKATVKIDRPGIFVLADSYYPGWKATVDGKEAKILKTNFYYRGVVLDRAGDHEIEFIFKPASFDLGIKISIITFVLFIILVIIKGMVDRSYAPAEEEDDKEEE